MIFNLIDEDAGPNAEVEKHDRRHSVYLVNTSHKRMGTNRYDRYSRHSPMSAEFVRVFASPKSLCQSSMFRFANLRNIYHLTAAAIDLQLFDRIFLQRD